MRILLELGLLLFGGGGCVATLAYIMAKRKPAIESAPDNCKHRRWTKWEVLQIEQINVYPDPDNGKDIPDRVDAQMRRDCIACGLTQYKTVRGIDSQHYK